MQIFYIYYSEWGRTHEALTHKKLLWNRRAQHKMKKFPKSLSDSIDMVTHMYSRMDKRKTGNVLNVLPIAEVFFKELTLGNLERGEQGFHVDTFVSYK